MDNGLEIMLIMIKVFLSVRNFVPSSCSQAQNIQRLMNQTISWLIWTNFKLSRLQNTGWSYILWFYIRWLNKRTIDFKNTLNFSRIGCSLHSFSKKVFVFNVCSPQLIIFLVHSNVPQKVVIVAITHTKQGSSIHFFWFL